MSLIGNTFDAMREEIASLRSQLAALSAERDEAMPLLEQLADPGLARTAFEVRTTATKAIRALKRDPSPARTDSGWRDIETAPKDGTALWLIEPGRYAGLTVPHHQIMGAWEPDGRYTAGGYWREVSRDYAILATHWQPLPAPPTPGEQQREG